jgi:hypothetical protein
MKILVNYIICRLIDLPVAASSGYKLEEGSSFLIARANLGCWFLTGKQITFFINNPPNLGFSKDKRPVINFPLVGCAGKYQILCNRRRQVWLKCRNGTAYAGS